MSRTSFGSATTPPEPPSPGALERRGAQVMKHSSVFQVAKRADGSVNLPTGSELDDPVFIGNFLRSLPLFSALAMPKMVAELAKTLRPVAFNCGQEVVERGEDEHSMYFVLKGALDMYMNDECVGCVRSGQSIGETHLLGMERIWTVTLTAKENAIVGCITRAELKLATENIEKPSSILEACWEVANKTAHGQYTKIELFRGLSGPTCSSLEKHSIPRAFFPGQKIMKEGDTGDDLYVLLQGKVALEVGGKIVRNLDRAELPGPPLIGELGLLGFGKTRTATVIATTVCFFKVLQRKLFLNALKDYNESLNLGRIDELMKNRYDSDAFAKSAIKSIKLFEDAGCGKGFIEYLVSQLDERMYVTGQTIMEGSDDQQCMFILKYGQVTVRRQGVVVKVVGEGGCIGEAQCLGLILAQSKLIKATATESCFTARLHSSAVIRGLELFPEERTKVLSAACMIKEAAGEKSSGRAGLRQAPFFSGMSSVLVDKLAAQASERMYLPGEVIFEEGSTGNSMHVLLFGQVAVWNRRTDMVRSDSKHSSVHKEMPTWDKMMCKQVATLSGGAILGEMAMLGFSLTRGATIEVQGLTSTLELTQQACFSIISEFQDAQRRFSAIICERLEPTVQERLSHLPLFENFDRNLALLLGLSCERRIYFPGAKIARMAQAGDGLYIINRGLARLETSGITIKQALPGGHFGAGIMLGLQTRCMCSLSAMRMCHILVISRENFVNALTLYPSPEVYEEVVKSEKKEMKELREAVKKNEVRQLQKMRSKADFLREFMNHHGKIDDIVDKSEELFAHRILEQFLHHWRESTRQLRGARLQKERRRNRREEWIRQKQDAVERRHEKEVDPESVGLRYDTPPGADSWNSSPAAKAPLKSARGKRGEASKVEALPEFKSPVPFAPYQTDQKTGKKVTPRVRQLPALGFMDRWRAMVDEMG